MIVALILSLASQAIASKMDLKPSIPSLVDSQVPAILAFWEVKMMIGNPLRLPNTVDRRAAVKDEPYRHFYNTLREYRDDPELGPAWTCASKVKLSLEDAQQVAALIVPKEQRDEVAGLLMDLSDTSSPTIKDIRKLESIKIHHRNYQPSLIRLAKLRIRAISSACPQLAQVMHELESCMYMRPEDIKQDNAELDADDQDGIDKAALIAMTVIGIVSVIINVVQGVFAAQQSFRTAGSPLMSIKQ